MLIVILFVIAALVLFVAYRHEWDWRATLAAFAAAGVAVWQAVEVLWGTS
jgi:hypothetical protein